MTEGSVSLFRCPLCGAPLSVMSGACKCPSGHSFDIAKEGYVNLLPANRKHSREPGDDAGMALARREFLSGGSYAPLAGALAELCVELAPENAVVIDSGCGEGYYTARIFAALQSAGISARAAGVDLSRPSVKRAAKLCRDAEFAIASVYHLPLSDKCADILVNCFSPLAIDEFRRVIRSGGYYIYVVPAAGHLWELKQVLYDSPYPNAEENILYDGFEYDRVVPVTFSMLLEQQALANLFRMTPYYWKTPQAGAEKLAQLDKLKITADFRIHVFRRK